MPSTGGQRGGPQRPFQGVAMKQLGGHHVKPGIRIAEMLEFNSAVQTTSHSVWILNVGAASNSQISINNLKMTQIPLGRVDTSAKLRGHFHKDAHICDAFESSLSMVHAVCGAQRQAVGFPQC